MSCSRRWPSWTTPRCSGALAQLVEAEVLYQRGLPPQATYIFKHALIQDAAYQSLLKKHPAAVPPAHCPGAGGAVSRHRRDPARTAGPSLHRGGPRRAGHRLLAAGGRARHASARPMLEAVQHLHQGAGGARDAAGHPRTGPAGTGPADHPWGGVAWPPRALRPRKWSTPMPAPGSCASRWRTPRSSSRRCRACTRSIMNRGELPTARELGEQLAHPGAAPADPMHLLGRTPIWGSLVFPGRAGRGPGPPGAGLALTDAQPVPRPCSPSGQDPGVPCLAYAALTLWCLGYPAQALKRSQEALTLAQELAHPFSLARPCTMRVAPSLPPGGAPPGAGRGRSGPGDGAGVCAMAARTRSSGAGRWPRRASARRAWPRCTRAWPPGRPRGQ